MSKILSIQTILVGFYFFNFQIGQSVGENAHAFKRTNPTGPIITITHGKIKGKTMFSRNGSKYYGFLGIPYASPPIGNLRFEPPSKPSPWDNILETTHYKSKCIQYNIATENVEGEEDCLYLNVFTPKIPSKGHELDILYPVMIYFHSGAFMFGTASTYDTRYFMDEKVVFVTVSYRLGSFGFLNTGDEIVSGNMGLKDQVMAIKWVAENIHNFYGNKDLVTLIGESSGGASVHYHILSKMSNGLFHRAISMSGTALCPWAFRHNPRKNAKRLAAMINCPSNDNQQMVFCLKGKNGTELAWKHKDFFEWNTDPISPFAPSVENTLEETDIFLKDTPFNIIKSNEFSQVPWILGLTDQVCLLDAASILVDSKLTAEMNEDWYRISPLTFGYRDSSLLKDAVSNQIRSFYFGGKKISKNTEANLTNVYSDRYFGHCTRVSALLHKKANELSNVYLYLFTYKAPMRSHLALLNLNAISGVSEGDELSYLFHMEGSSYKRIFPEIKRLTKYYDFSRRFVSLWVSFAKDGKPTKVWGQQWNPIQTDEIKGDVALRYYQIDNSSKFIFEPNRNRMIFWDNLPLNEFDENTSIYSRNDNIYEDEY